jgi:GTP cyclohydrolase IA
MRQDLLFNENTELRFLGINKAHTSGIQVPAPETDSIPLTDEQKMTVISRHFRSIMETLGLDLEDDSLRGTPDRVAKMYVREIFKGLNPSARPRVALFDNVYKYGQMLVEKNITLYSTCEHHFVPIVGRAHVAYISSGRIIGLSKLNRIVRYFAERPQVQERLTMQIAAELKHLLQTEHVAVVISASHLCVSSRGIKDVSSETVTSAFHGRFSDVNTRNEFLQYIK